MKTGDISMRQEKIKFVPSRWFIFWSRRITLRMRATRLQSVFRSAAKLVNSAVLEHRMLGTVDTLRTIVPQEQYRIETEDLRRTVFALKSWIKASLMQPC